jgi:membrane protease subunit (stomatin/prohibitin family)
MALIQFVRNYDDLSTDKGYQFKFYCDKCGNGELSRFQPSLIGTAGSLLRAAGDIFGGVFGQAGNSAYEIQRAVGGKAHDDAIAVAVEEAKPSFTQCVRCGHWVCNEVCWNTARGLCTSCAPKTEVEIAAAQSEAQIEQIREKVRAQDQTKDLNLEREMVARCPKCKAETAGGKFCPDCGASLAAPKDQCACGAKLAPNAKFCPECGEKR